MSFKKFDDHTGKEIPILKGIQVTATLQGESSVTKDFANWDYIPEYIVSLSTNPRLSSVTIRDVSVATRPGRKSVA